MCSHSCTHARTNSQWHRMQDKYTMSSCYFTLAMMCTLVLLHWRLLMDSRSNNNKNRLHIRANPSRLGWVKCVRCACVCVCICILYAYVVVIHRSCRRMDHCWKRNQSMLCNCRRSTSSSTSESNKRNISGSIK